MNIPYGLKTMAVLAFVGGAWLGTPSAEPAPAEEWYLGRTCEPTSVQARPLHSPLNFEQWARGNGTFLKTEILSRDESNRPDVIAVHMQDPEGWYGHGPNFAMFFFRNPYLCRVITKMSGTVANLR